MSLSVRHLTDVGLWTRGSGMEIVLIVTGTILLTRLATWLGARITDRIDATARETDALVRSEASKHRHALAQVITWAPLPLIYCIAAVAIVERFGIPLASLVAAAAVAGVALGFGAQRIVQDILAGFFIITERQYGFGDLIRLSIPGVPDQAIGTVEDVTLRVTTVRTARSEEHTSELQSHLNLVCRLLLEKKNSTSHEPHRLTPSRHDLLFTDESGRRALLCRGHSHPPRFRRPRLGTTLPSTFPSATPTSS